MENLDQYTPTELLKMINDINKIHDRIKAEIIGHTIDVDNLEIVINNKLSLLEELEKKYIELIEEIDKR